MIHEYEMYTYDKGVNIINVEGKHKIIGLLLIFISPHLSLDLHC